MRLKSAAEIPVVLSGLFLLAAELHGSSIITYTGTDYTSVGGSYTTAMSLSGTFTLTSPLASNQSLINMAPLILSYSIFDGLQTFNSGDSTLDYFDVSTGANGSITAWQFVFYGPLNASNTPFAQSCSNEPTTASDPPAVNSAVGGASYCTGSGRDYEQADENVFTNYGDTFTPGSFSSSATVPEPATFTLFLISLVSLGALRRKAFLLSRATR